MRCANHPDRDAVTFCFSCGNWYCNECISQKSSQPICINCINTLYGGDKNRGQKKNSIFNDIPFVQKIGLKRFLRYGSILSIVPWIIFGALVNPIYYILIAVSAGAFVYSFFVENSGNKKKILKTNDNFKKISNAQVFALLDKYKKITSKKLADATNSTIEASKKKLDLMVVENNLDIDIEDTDEDVKILYKRRLLT
jgi:hypothetical protein